MRARWLLVAVLVVAASWPAPASADGGAWIVLRPTDGSGSGRYGIFRTGGGVIGAAQVFVRGARNFARIEQGPFHAYLTPTRVAIRRGRPIPDEAIRLGTFTVRQQDAHIFAVSVSFTVPEVPSGDYSIQVCNDPCTVVGFGQWAGGSITVVNTLYERDLLIQTYRQNTEIYRLKRQVRRQAKDADELAAAFRDVSTQRDQLAGIVSSLQTRLAARTDPPAPPERSLLTSWAGLWIGSGLGLLALALLAIGRRPDRLRIPDTVEELERELHEPVDV